MNDDQPPAPKILLHASDDGLDVLMPDDQGYFSPDRAALSVPWADVLVMAPTDDLIVGLRRRHDLASLIPTATLQNEIIERERKAYASRGTGE